MLGGVGRAVSNGRPYPISWDFAAENDPAHREPPQHITASSKRQAFLSDADSEQAPSAQHHPRHDIPRRQTFIEADNRSSERRCSNEVIATNDANRRDRLNRRGDLATDLVIDARR